MVLRHWGLMFICKIIQNLANKVFFGKETHMTIFNSWAFLTHISKKSQSQVLAMLSILFDFSLRCLKAHGKRQLISWKSV